MKEQRAIAFGERLKAIRVHRGLSQRKLALLIGVHNTLVSHWETGYQGCLPIQQMHLCAALGCTLKELQGREVYNDQQRLMGDSDGRTLRFTKNKQGIMINGSLKTGNKVTLNIAPKKLDGTAAEVQGAPVWVNNGAGTLEVAADGKSAVVRQLPLKAVADVTVTADADLDDDETRELTENFVILGRSNDLNEASDLGGSMGTEEPDTEAPPVEPTARRR